MAVELQYLYREIRPEYEVKLHTDSCYDRKISWIHMVEGSEFAQFLYGDELVFKLRPELQVRGMAEGISGSHGPGRGRRGDHRAGGRESSFPREAVDWCNKRRLPLFSASWKTPYIDIMRKFSEILLKNEQRETNLVTAMKNAIFLSGQRGALHEPYGEKTAFQETSPTRSSL